MAKKSEAQNEISTTHPSYNAMLEDWTMMRDVYAGQRAVKAKGETYLPATDGMVQDGMQSGQLGDKRYEAYKARAVFPDYVSDAVEATIGIMHRKPAVIEVPEALEDLIEQMTNDGEDAQLALRRMNEQQLVYGRLGLLLDLPENPDPSNPQMYIAIYGALAVINWDKGRRDADGAHQLQMVVLDESEQVRTDTFTWEEVEKYRVLSIQEEIQNNDPRDGEDKPLPFRYHVGVFSEDGAGGLAFNKDRMMEPKLRGQALEDIPFVFINSKDILPDVDNPPLLGLADTCLTIYRGEADYRQSLFMQGQDTLVRIGYMEDDEEGEERAGSGAVIDLPIGGDAKYIGVSSQGLPEQRQALENDRARAAEKAMSLTDATSRSAESGDALRVRVAAQTATLVHVALAGAGALERLLKIAAEWVGANPDDVSVQPNLDFADDKLVGKELMDLMSAKTLGAPLSKKSIHAIMKRRELTEMDFEEELDEIESEEPDVDNPDLEDDDDAEGNGIQEGEEEGAEEVTDEVDADDE